MNRILNILTDAPMNDPSKGPGGQDVPMNDPSMGCKRQASCGRNSLFGLRSFYGVLCVAACILSCFFASLPVRAQALSEADKAAWKQRLVGITLNSVEGAKTIQDFLALDGDAGFAVLQDTWNAIPSAETRLYLINVLQDHPRILDILHLGVTDSSLVVQNRALQSLEPFSFENFAEDFSMYEAWRQKYAGKSLEETMRESCRDYIASVVKSDEALKFQRLMILQRISYNMGSGKIGRLRRKAMLEAGLPAALAGWVTQQSTVWQSFAVLRNLKMDEPYLRRVILPLIGPNVELNVRRQAIGVLATPDNRWATDILLKMFVQEYPDADTENMGYAVAQFGDPHVIPTLIAMLDQDKAAEGQRILGNILNIMTGNTTGQTHDGAWWHTWWTKNSGRFSPEVRALPFPKLALRQRPAITLPHGLQGAPEQHQIAGDIKRTYWLVRPVTAGRIWFEGPVRKRDAPPPPPVIKTTLLTAVQANPEKPGAIQPGAQENVTPGLLVVLPPDGNGATASLFWQEVEQKALKNHYYVAVLTAPKWSEAQTVTWVTGDNIKQVKEAKFSTEKFVADVVRDITASHAISADHIYLHGATDSGLAVYACSLEEITPFKGFYILASAFKSASLPPLTRAKNRRYVIQHSPEDKTAPYVMAAAAQKLLTEQGAAVKLQTYKGGHGYVFADGPEEPISSALAWLEK